MIETFESENLGIKIVVETQDWEQMTPKFLPHMRRAMRPTSSGIMDEMVRPWTGALNLWKASS
ncbi:MAG: hypothetical protein ACLSBB_13905 [Ruthenibacterium lactatiformans]